jgi:N6-adenosine-specific RNA methylase IME4
METTKSVMKYRTIVADPPWRYDQHSTSRGIVDYPTMTIGEIAMLRVADHAEQDAHLWLWTTNAFMEEAHRVARCWGFHPLTIVTWCKPGPGVGHYVRNNTEHIIFATKGRAQTPVEKPLSSWFVWPRGKHSEKPGEFYDLVEQVSPSPRLEMFARRQHLGWDTWGDEALRHVELA